MNTLEKTLIYEELLMTYEDTSKNTPLDLPKGFDFVFYQPQNKKDWVNIHIESGEFTDFDRGLSYFYDFFGHFEKELSTRCIFIENKDKEKIATATISILKEKENNYDAALDWVAIKQDYQGLGLSKPLITKAIQIACHLGHKQLILHTQTHSWLAAKIYLDLGFQPYQANNHLLGWHILKTITHHPILANIATIELDQMYSSLALSIERELTKIHPPLSTMRFGIEMEKMMSTYVPKINIMSIHFIYLIIKSNLS